mgnify:CR=1 FL=1
MAVYLPKIPKFVEYRPSMVGVPTTAVARMYDRLDRDALRTQSAATKMKIALSEQMAGAAEGDKAYLQGLYDSVDQAITKASQDNNLPGYSRQIKSMVSNMMGDPTFAAVRNNTKRVQEADATYRKLAAQYGTSNVMMDGDLMKNFSTVDPETGETRQFSGMPIRIPDFAAAMDQVYMKNVDNVSSLSNLEEYVYGGGEESALGFYVNSPGGRSHINMIAQQVSSEASNGQDIRSFNRIDDPVQKKKVQDILNQELFNAGKRYLKTSSTSGLPDNMQGKGVLSSGQNQTTLTDGNPDTEDQVMVTFDDQVNNSRIDNQLTLMYESDRDIPLLDINTGKMPEGRNSVVSSSDLVGAKLTGVIGPNGLPVIQLEMKKDTQKGTGGFVYTEMQAEDAGTLAANMGEFKAQLLQDATAMQTRTSAAPLFGAAYEPGLNSWATSDNEDVYDAASIGLEVRKENGMFHFYNKSGKHMKNKSGDPVAFGSIREVQIAIGNQILQIS